MSLRPRPASAHGPLGPTRSEPALPTPLKSVAESRTRQPRPGAAERIHSAAAAAANPVTRPHNRRSTERPTSAPGSGRAATRGSNSAADPSTTAHSGSRRPPSTRPGAAPSPPPTVSLVHASSHRKSEHDERRAERMQKIKDLAKTIAALQLECAIEPSTDLPVAHIAPAADGDVSRRRVVPRPLSRSTSPTRQRPSRPQSVLAAQSGLRASSPPPTDPPPHYAAPTLASQLHQRNPRPNPKSKHASAGHGRRAHPRHRQNSPNRTLPIPTAPTRPPPLELKSLALLRKIKLDTDPVAKMSRPRPLALPRPFLGLSRLEDLGTRPAGGGQDGVGVGRSARVALHKAIEAQLEDLYRELDSDSGVYGGLGKEVKVADAVGAGFKAGIDDWALGADETMRI